MNGTEVFLKEHRTIYFLTLGNFFNDDAEKTEIMIQMPCGK